MNKRVTVVFIIDDDLAVRESLSLMIKQDGLTVHTFESAEAFLATCSPECFGCAIIDIRMPGMDGLELHKKLRNREIPLPVIFLTGHGDIPMSVRAIKDGAVDFLTKPVTREKLMECVHAAIKEGERALAQAAKTRKAIALLAELTEREREVMALAVAGHPNKAIADRLGISHRTVEIHKGRVMHKTETTNLLDLARIAQEADLDHC